MSKFSIFWKINKTEKTFHLYSRGMKFENVSKLVETVANITEDMRFSW
jgi:hypothetical protein